jgi:hypothetical protein
MAKQLKDYELWVTWECEKCGKECKSKLVDVCVWSEIFSGYVDGDLVDCICECGYEVDRELTIAHYEL